MCVTHTHTQLPQCSYGGQRTISKSGFFPSTVWVVEIKIRSLDMAVGAISLALTFNLVLVFLIFVK